MTSLYNRVMNKKVKDSFLQIRVDENTKTNLFEAAKAEMFDNFSQWALITLKRKAKEVLKDNWKE